MKRLLLFFTLTMPCAAFAMNLMDSTTEIERETTIDVLHEYFVRPDFRHKINIILSDQTDHAFQAVNRLMFILGHVSRIQIFAAPRGYDPSALINRNIDADQLRMLLDSIDRHL